MKVINSHLRAVLDPEAKSSRRGSDNPPTALGPRSFSIASIEPVKSSPTRSQSTANLASVAPPAKEPDTAASEKASSFDLLHTQSGFQNFERWYLKALNSSRAASIPQRPAPDCWWPEAYCPPTALHEHAFLELMRVFTECAESDAMDFFDLLDYNFMGILGFSQIYIAMVLLAAMGSRQLTKFMYFHSSTLFAYLCKGCRFNAAPDCVTWARLLVLLRLLGVKGASLSEAGELHGMTPLSQIDATKFEEILFPLVLQLDRGIDIGEITVISECDRTSHVKAKKMCSVL